MTKGGAVYITTNLKKTTLYTGVTSNLKKRIWQHKNFVYPKSFTCRYKIIYLVYYEGFHNIKEAIAREKQLKGGSRKQKEDLINSMNPYWNDLYKEVSEF